MTRRKNKRLRLTPSHLPLIRDKFVTVWRERAMRQYEAKPQYRRILDGMWSEIDQMSVAQLWWVSRDMAKLAADTAAQGDLPRMQAPAASGVMFLEGGVPVDTSSIGITSNVAGFFWDRIGDGETSVMAFTDDPESLRKSGADSIGLPIDWLDLTAARAKSIHDADAVFQKAWIDYLQAVWALSGEPRICDTKPAEPSMRYPLPSRFEPEIRKVKMLVLRENLHRPGESSDDDERVRREYSHRFIVRGFWRDQAYGPNHSLRRRQWIPPFVKGPSDKPLICKETVRIWRR